MKEDALHSCRFPGGETEALARMEEKVGGPNPELYVLYTTALCSSPICSVQVSQKTAAWVRAFEKPATSPNSLEPSTTVLSPHLKFGCLSPRLFYWRLEELYKGSKHSQPPVSLHGQLLWREFFYTVGYGTPNFDKMEGNSVCRQVNTF